MNELDLRGLAGALLTRHGYPVTRPGLIGEGAQSVCYGTDDIAILIGRPPAGDEPDLTGHSIPDGDGPVSYDGYPVLRWVTARAADAGVRTPRILAVGDDPRPYALIERAHGRLASAHPRVAELAPEWFGRLGAEIRKTNLVETNGFGMFVPGGPAGYRGRFATWTDYLDGWLRVHLCVGGRPRPKDEQVLSFLLAQGIVTERELALVASKVREAQAWPVTSVLTHYDNRLDNILVGTDGITVLDWGLSLAGIGIAQELVKLFETGSMDLENPRVAAFLHGYGLSDREGLAAIEDGKLMLVLDGIGMSYGWVDNPDWHDGVRGWLRTVKRICAAW